MNLQIKVLQGLARGNYAIAITRGVLNVVGFEHVLEKVIEATRPFDDCKALIDFQDCTFRFLPSDVTEFIARFDFEKWPQTNKIALVSAPDIEQYRHLAMLGEPLSKAKRGVGVFSDTRKAIVWLADNT